MTLTKILSLFLSFCLIFEQGVFAQTIDLSHYFARNSASAVTQSDKFRPLHLRYVSYDNQANDFKILLDKGDFFNQQTPQLPNSSTPKLEEATQELMKYFFIGLALPNEKFWVNLRPDSPDNILDPDLEKTDIGRIFLETDLQLKKDTSGMTSPQIKEGREYWDKLYKKAGELFGRENITIPTLTRPWIVPDEVIIRESPEGAYIYKATLKVMLEEDYLNQKTEKPKDQKTEIYSFSDPRLKELNEYSTQLIKESIIPRLTREINSARRYAPLRQVYYSLILAQWFKQKYSSSGSIRASGISAPVNSYINLIDSGNLANLTLSQPYDKQGYFQQYQKSFKDGEYNLQEPVYTPMGQSIRRYVSGGIMIGAKEVEGAVFKIQANISNSSPIAPFLMEPFQASSAVEKLETTGFNKERLNSISEKFGRGGGSGLLNKDIETLLWGLLHLEYPEVQRVIDRIYTLLGAQTAYSLKNRAKEWPYPAHNMSARLEQKLETTNIQYFYTQEADKEQFYLELVPSSRPDFKRRVVQIRHKISSIIVNGIIFWGKELSTHMNGGMSYDVGIGKRTQCSAGLGFDYDVDIHSHPIVVNEDNGNLMNIPHLPSPQDLGIAKTSIILWGEEGFGLYATKTEIKNEDLKGYLDLLQEKRFENALAYLAEKKAAKFYRIETEPSGISIYERLFNEEYPAIDFSFKEISADQIREAISKIKAASKEIIRRHKEKRIPLWEKDFYERAKKYTFQEYLSPVIEKTKKEIELLKTDINKLKEKSAPYLEMEDLKYELEIKEAFLKATQRAYEEMINKEKGVIHSTSSAVWKNEEILKPLEFSGFGTKSYPEILEETIAMLQEEAKKIRESAQELDLFTAYNNFKEGIITIENLTDKIKEWSSKIKIDPTEKKVFFLSIKIATNYDFVDKLNKIRMQLSLREHYFNKESFERAMDAYIKLLSDIQAPLEIAGDYAETMDESKSLPQLTYTIMLQYKEAFKNGATKVSSSLDVNKPGGIDLSRINKSIRTESAASSGVGGLNRPVDVDFDLNEELGRLQNLLNAEIIPSASRLDRYARAARASSDSSSDSSESALSLIAETFRLQEEKAVSAPAELKALAAWLEQTG